MRTLKKTLALVLVVAMLLSFGVTASAAGIVDEQFTDAADIQNELAVNAMTAIGVINGMGDGTFDPTGTLTRAQGAKMICFMLGLDEYIEKCETPFMDVPEAFWASGYIAYCADNNIVDGYGDGNFGPNDILTGYQWAKMLICAFDLAAWDAEKEVWTPSLTGAAWQINVAKLAVDNGLWVGDKNSQKNPVSRDFACLHAFNLIEDTLAITEAVELDAYGAPAATTYSMDLGEEELTVIYSEEIAPVAVYTKNTEVETLEKDLGIGEDDTYALVDADNAEYTWDETTGNGVVVKVYATATEGTYQVFVIEYDTYVVQEDDITEADEENDVKASVEINGIALETDAFAADDVVLYSVSKAGTEIASAEKLEATTVKVTAKGTGYVKAGTDKYEGAEGVDVNLTIGTEYNLYLDRYGYIQYAAPVEEEVVEAESTSVYVVAYYDIFTPAVDPELDAYGKPVSGTGSEEKTDYYAQAVTAAGEVVTYAVAAEASDAGTGIKAVTYDEETELYTIGDAEDAATITIDADKISASGYYYNTAKVISIVGKFADIAVAEGTLKSAEGEQAVIFETIEDSTNKTVTVIFTYAEEVVEETEDPTQSYALLATGAAATETSSVTWVDAEGNETVKAVYTHTVYINGEKTEILSYLKEIAVDFYSYNIDEYNVYVLTEIDGVYAQVENVYGSYVTVAGLDDAYDDFDITGIKVVDLTEEEDEGNAGVINAEEYVAFYASVKDDVVTIACIYIVPAPAAK